MFEGRYAPLPSQAEITGKFEPDLKEFMKRKVTNNGDAGRLQFCYGVARDDLLQIKQGELLMRKKGTDGVFSAWNGFYYGGYTNPEALMREYDCVATAMDDYNYGGDTMYGQDPLDHKMAGRISGSETINNHGVHDIPAGILVQWTVEPFVNGQPRGQHNPQPYTIDTGLNPMVPSRNRAGTPYEKILTRVEPFDPSDYSFQITGAFHTLERSVAEGGIRGLRFQDYLRGDRNMSSLQEEGLGWAGGILAILANAPRILGDLGLGGADGDELVQQFGLNDSLSETGHAALRKVFLRNCMPGTNEAAVGGINFRNYNANNAMYHLDHVFDYLAGAVGSATAAKWSRVLGRSLSTGKTAKSFDIIRKSATPSQ